MEITQTNGSASTTTSDCQVNEGLIKVVSKTLIVRTNGQTDLIDLTAHLHAFVAGSGIAGGYVQLSSLHTTAALFINEWQDALLTDVRMTLDRLVPPEIYYRHNDPRHSDCDRKNAVSHLRNTILGNSLSIPITRGELVLGRWQRVIFAEFDGPNERKVFAQALGVSGEP